MDTVVTAPVMLWRVLLVAHAPELRLVVVAIRNVVFVWAGSKFSVLTFREIFCSIYGLVEASTSMFCMIVFG